jgi:hypothetical protein
MPVRDHAFDDADLEPASRVELRFVPEGVPAGPDHEEDGGEALSEDAPTRPDMRAAFSFFARVPTLVAAPEELMRLPLDHRAGFFLSLIDGRSSIGAILDACAMPSDEALKILNALLAQHVVRLDG